MAVYKISDILSLLSEMIQDGFLFTEIIENSYDNDFPASLSFSALSKSDCIDYEEIEAIDFSDSSVRMTSDDISSSLIFTFDELCTLMNAVDNALEYGKERLKRSDCDKDENDAIKHNAVDLRNLQAKFAKFRKRFGIIEN